MAGTESQHQQPLLENPTPAAPILQTKRSPKRKIMKRTFNCTAHLANLLPTGTVLVFQFLSPIITNQGRCNTERQTTIAGIATALCAFSCFVLSFTDSFRDAKGKVRYGLATRKGLWVIDGSKSASLTTEEAEEYRLRAIDFVHGIMSVWVFAAVALIDKNMVGCFFPVPSEKRKNVLAAVPIGICIICSVLFIAFPTRRHGVGFPLSSR